MLNTAYINLNNLVYNAKAIKRNLPKGVKFFAVVKADAYGHGAPECANAIYNLVDGFCVALKEEAMKLKCAGIKKEILLLIPPFKQDVKELVEEDITISVFKKEQVFQIEKVAKMLNKRAKVHVIFNSGMNRLGIESISALKDFVDYCKKLKHVEVAGIFSHFACPENDQLREKAVQKFLLAKNVIKDYNSRAVAHVSASGGFLKGEYFDLVRIGIMLYGYLPFKDKPFPLKKVMKITSKSILQKKIKKGESALYGFKPSDKNLSLNLIRYGYADGLERREVLGQFNNRCMDITAVTKKGKEIVVLDNADTLAKQYNTISYEILTKSALRAEKIYVK